jgi:hypothetical protein
VQQVPQVPHLQFLAQLALLDKQVPLDYLDLPVLLVSAALSGLQVLQAHKVLPVPV